MSTSRVEVNVIAWIATLPGTGKGTSITYRTRITAWFKLHLENKTTEFGIDFEEMIYIRQGYKEHLQRW